MLSRNSNQFTIHATTIKNLEIGHKSDVTTIAMATKTIQDGGYFGLNAFYFENRQVTPIFYFIKHFFKAQ